MATPSAPRFLKPIPTRTTCLARSVGVLEVFLKGRPIPNITWHKNGAPITIENKYQMHFEDTGKCCLIINGVDEDDEGEYECRAKNCYGQVSCFGEMYIKNDAPNTKFVDPCKQNRIPVSGEEECSVGSEGKSGLFILIDEGSQDDENSADEMGYKQSISASEQIESIIEDLTMGDGSLSLSIGREGTFASNLDTQEDLPLDDNQYFKSKELCDFRQENCFEDADDVDKDIAIKLNDCKMKGQLTIGQQKLSLQLRKVAGVEDNLHQAFDCENESRAVTSQEFDCLKAADVDGYWKFQSGLSVKPFCTVQQNCQQISLSPDESYEAFTTCDGRLISSCQNYVAEQLNNGGREDMGSSSIGCTAKEEATIPKHKKDSESDLDRFRRNTTDGILPEMTNNEMKSHRRCSSDRKESHEIMGFPEHHYRNSLQQQQTWNSFQNNWKDACLAESEDDQLCSDLEPDHDDVFIEHFREENEFSVDSSNSLDHISEVKEE